MNDNKCAAVLMGPPGSGKSTVVRALTAHNGMSVIEAGNLLEAEVRLNTPLGQRIKPYKAAGDLVPLECVVQVISAELKNASESLVLFDGFPRCAGQAAPFLQLLKDHRLTLGAVFVLTLDVATAIQRLGGRRICPKCNAVYNVHTNPPRKDGRCDQCGGELIRREDDREEVIRRRFANFERETSPVIEFFARKYAPMTRQPASHSTLDETVTQFRKHLDEAVAILARSAGIRPTGANRATKRAVEYQRWECPIR